MSLPPTNSGRPHRVVLAAVALALASIAPAGAMTLDDLKGYSIELDSVYHLEWRNSRSFNAQFHRKLYIGQSGRIFDYADVTTRGYARQERGVVAPGGAMDIGPDRMLAWTFEQGHLLGISHENQGFVVRQLTVDPSRTACSVAVILHPDPATGKVMLTKRNNTVDELVAIPLISQTCTVTKGNIFATDQ
ncbi:MAG TPA: hypothetical protein VG651_02070 [Stellaceae bacterium]|nr:hypothetical protein [Stellaceae bacterium]